VLQWGVAPRARQHRWTPTSTPTKSAYGSVSASVMMSTRDAVIDGVHLVGVVSTEGLNINGRDYFTCSSCRRWVA